MLFGIRNHLELSILIFLHVALIIDAHERVEATLSFEPFIFALLKSLFHLSPLRHSLLHLLLKLLMSLFLRKFISFVLENLRFASSSYS